MSVVEAKFRPATPEEVAYAKGGFIWRMANIPWNLTMKVLGTCELYLKKANPLVWQSPLPLRITHNIKWLCGLAPERGFIRVMPTFIRTWNFIDGEPKVLEAFFKHFRNEGIFTNSSTMLMICKIVQGAFPDSGITPEDLIFTCSPKQNTVYHNLILSLIAGSHLRNARSLIQQEAAETLGAWEAGCQQMGKINATIETRLFASRVISRLVFGQSMGDEEVAKSINFINSYIVQLTLKKATEEDHQKFKETLKIFNQAVAKILEQGDKIPLFAESKVELTLTQKQAMVFTIFFAGQETVAALITHMLRVIARDEILQIILQSECDQMNAKEENEQSRVKAIQDLFVRCIREFPPAYGLTRALDKDTCLEFLIEGETKPRKLIFPKGEALTAFMYQAAQRAPAEMDSYQNWYPFGHGPHRCPGESLVREEVYYLLMELLSNYKISTDQNREIPKIGFVTLQYAEDIFITLCKRANLKRTQALQ